MIHRRCWFSLSLACLACVQSASSADAQHFDVLVQNVGGKLTTGFADIDGGVNALGARVFSRYFNSLFAISDPGFNSIGTSAGTLPPGSDALPGATDLFWDFLPMKTDSVTSNMLYWNGAGVTPAEVLFGPPPAASYSLSLFGENEARAAADGSEQLISGHSIDTTAADGFIHSHRFFFLDNDHDDNNPTVAADGVYLISMRLRMAGLDRSEPLFLIFGTPTATLSALQAADMWVTDRMDQLAPDFNADFDGDLDVDGADFLTWQRHLGMASALQMDGDADRDRMVGPGDLAAWQSEFGASLETFPGAVLAAAAMAVGAVPEPAGVAIALLTATIMLLVRWTRVIGGRAEL